MDFEYYRNFITITESGSLNAAAKKLHIAQSALSHQLRIIEEKYGCQLLKLKQGTRKLELTDAGRLFLQKAKDLSSLEETTRVEIQNLTSGVSGTLKISIAPAKTIGFIKNHLIPFSRLYPAISYQLHESSINDQMQEIISGISDIAITNTTLPDSSFFRIMQKEKEFFQAVAAQDNPWLSAQSSFTIKDLQAAPLCLNYVNYSPIAQACFRHGFTPKITALSTTRIAAIQFAANTLGVALVTREKGERLADELFAIPVEDEGLYIEQTLFISKDKPLPILADTFLHFYLESTSPSSQSTNTKP